jgi:hypothetical protein
VPAVPPVPNIILCEESPHPPTLSIITMIMTAHSHFITPFLFICI